MKKSIFLLFSVALLCSLVGCGIGQSNTSIALSGEVVDNAYNNAKSFGGLIRVEDTLYFQYYKDHNSHGIMAISEQGAERIYQASPSFPYVIYPDIREYNGNLVFVHSSKGVIEWMDIQSRTILTDTPPLFAPNFSCEFRQIGLELFYVSDANQGNDYMKNLYAYHIVTGETRLILQDLYTCYIVNDAVYYALSSSKELRKYEISSGEDQLLLDREVHDIYIEGQHVIYKTESGVFACSVYSESIEQESVCLASGRCRIANVWNGQVYIASGSGFYKVDIYSCNTIKLMDEEVLVCAIVDNKWVYFYKSASGYSELWRVSQDGTITEMVFEG